MSDAAQEKRMGLDLTTGRILPLILKFFWPFFLANVLNSLYNTVDSVIIGHFVGAAGLTASATAGRVMQVFNYVSVGLSAGGQTVISQILGAKKRDELNGTIGTMMTELISLSVIFGAATALLSRNIIGWLSTPSASAEDAFTYLFITSLGMPLIYGYNCISGVLRAMGDSKRPLIFIAISTGVNVAGDLILVGIFGMGVAGAAIATVAAQGISLICSVVILYRQRERFGFDFRLRSFRICADKLKLMLKVGVPMALREVLLMSTKLVINKNINMYDPNEVAAYNVSDKFYSLSNIFTFSTRQAGGTIIAQNVGANKNDRVKATVRDMLIMNMIVCALICGAALLIPRQIFSIFTSDEGVLAFAPLYMLISCLMFIFSSFNGPFDSVVIGVGNSGLSFLGGLLDGVVLRLGLGLMFGLGFKMGAVGFFLGDCLSRMGVTLVSFTYYVTGGWKKAKKLTGK